MFHLYRVLAVLILFTVQSHAYVDFINELEFNAETSSLTHTKEGKCILDLLILLDMSKSIGTRFDNNVKPFLKNLIGNDELNVGPDGTHVSLILFSNKEDTKVAFKFGKYSTRESLQKYFANLEYDIYREARTYTGEALKKANNEVFKEKGPGNHRAYVDDVLLLITDGEPNGEGNGKETEIAIDEATKLWEEKSVTIIGVAVLLNDLNNLTPKIQEYYKTVEKIVGSVERTMNVTFKELDNNKKIDKMVDMLCSEIALACRFKCPLLEAMFFVKKVGGEAKVKFPSPEITPENDDAKQRCKKSLQGPADGYYAIGTHELNHTYTFTGGQITCPIKIIVKVKCGGRTYDPSQQKCCCGKLWRKIRFGHKCCGYTYINGLTDHCCDQETASYVANGESCD